MKGASRSLSLIFLANAENPLITPLAELTRLSHALPFHNRRWLQVTNRMTVERGATTARSAG